MDHRWGHRASAYLRVQVLPNSQPPRVGWLRDVSISGAYVSTVAPPPLLARVRIVWGSTARVEPIGLEGYVVRTTSDGFAVEWMDIAPPGMESLTRALLERLSPENGKRARALPEASEPRANRSLARRHRPEFGARAEQYPGAGSNEPAKIMPIVPLEPKRRLA